MALRPAQVGSIGMGGFLSKEVEGKGSDHEELVGQVKARQRESETARQAWKNHCDALGGGIRDPRKHDSEFLQGFLHEFQDGRNLTSTPKEFAELAVVASSELALGANQITLRMPTSEEGIVREVVSTNVYGFLPGRTCVLREGDIVLDIGAHVGVAATLARRTKDVTVICVEPHPVTFEILRQNMTEHGERVTLVNKAVAETDVVRPLYTHCGTNSPSRLYFSSLFDTRRHDDETIPIECVPLQDLVSSHKPTVIKIDAEGAERFLSTVYDFGSVRLIVAEWDWTHNRHRSEWHSVEAHLRNHGFTIEVKGRMPEFGESGNADLCDARGKKRGNTGMIFAASRKAATQAVRPTCQIHEPVLPLASADGCPVGALVCDVLHLRRVFDACRVSALAQQKGAVPHNGRMALHLNLEGAALLCAGQAPPEVQELLDEGCVGFLPGLRKGAQAYRGALARAPSPVPGLNPRFTFIELFAGIGGFRRGLEPLGGRCVFSSEIDTDCQETYALNFGRESLFGDVTAIPTEDFPAHDILTAGFPCQPFARRGERLGFTDGRGGLFLEIPRVLRARRPAGFLLENVWNLQFLDGGQWDKDERKCVYGNCFKNIIHCLQQAGYVVQTKVLFAQGWVPQDRERLYIVGFRSDLAERASKLFKWPEPPGGGVVRDVLEPPESAEARSCELTEKQWAAVQRSSTWQSGGADLRFADPDGVASTLTASYKSSYASVAELVGPAEAGLDRPRFFTRRECARLMGFGEDHDLGNPGCPNRAYHQFGNAVCPPLINAVARNLVHSLGLGSGRDDVAAEARVEEEQEDFTEEEAWEDEKEKEEEATEYLTTTGAQPELREQLEALTVEQMSSRLEAFGELVRQPRPEEFVRGFKAARRVELLDALCAGYAARADSQPRNVVHDVGVPLPEHATEQLLEALRMMDWKENVRPAVHASGYAVLKQPYELKVQPRWREGDPRAVRRRIWELSEALLRAASAKAAGFHFTAIAVSKNFRGSPHVDKNDLSVQYALSLGDFDEGGGKLCVEESAFVVRAIETRGRLACFDGRFPHWVSGYVGERYSVIFYRSSGEEDAPVQAVHDV
mmetsp:Transcript_23213/g.65910  ORF Transcript_23213/g.65910 Transcript_23213/m.65910 type:complete len:1084 (-) Transcript_23213:29-3280(-)